MRSGIRFVLWVFSLSVLGYSLWQLWGIYRDYRQGEQSYEALTQYVAFAEIEQTGENTDKRMDDLAQEEPIPDVSDWPQVDFEELAQINPDIVGWIFLEGTNINYPVVQGQDNDYYLDRLFDGTRNDSGCVFMDAGCKKDFSGRNSVLYGHHMKDKSMFAILPSYKSQTFYEEHPEMLLVTPDAYYRVRFFSGYVADTFANAWGLHFQDDSFGKWLEELRGRSCFATEDSPGVEDRIITLSTCTYEFTSAKFVLHGYISEQIMKN